MRTLIASSTILVAALLAAPSVSVAQNGQFCLKNQAGQTSCIYQSMAACEQVKQANDQCLSASQLGTTGSGGNGYQSPSR